MKRHRGLYQRVCSWENLLLAAAKARKGKRSRQDVARFEFDLEQQLYDLHRRLVDQTYSPGGFRTFEIFDPKHRLISAAPYRDRVVHHAVCNIIEPLFEKGFVSDSYACRIAKGTHAAVKRAQGFARRHAFVLKTDFAKFFPSIDHEILLHRLARRINDEAMMGLLRTIVLHPYPGQARPRFFPGDTLFTPIERTCGLPIGNQTSQFFGNVMLDPIDHVIKEQLRCPGYVRYMDDLLLFGDSKQQLWEWNACVRVMAQEMRLRLHVNKTNVTPTRCGFRFLGFRVYADRLQVRQENLTRLRRRMRNLQQLYGRGEITLPEIRHRVASAWGHLKLTRAVKLYRDVLSDYAFIKDLREANKREQEASTSESPKTTP